MKIRGVVLSFIIMIFAASGYSAAQESRLRVGIMPLSKKMDRSSDAIISGLTTQMSKYKFIQLIERAKMDKAMKEIEMGQTGVIDESTAAQVGKVSGVEVMIVGTAGSDSISFRAVHVETQKVLASDTIISKNDLDSLSSKLAKGLLAYLNQKSLKSINNKSGDIDLQFWVEKRVSGKTVLLRKGESLKIGDSIIFKFKSNTDGYLTIIDVQPGGDVVMLFPNDYQQDNRIIAGAEYSIPGKNDTFELTIGEPAGADLIKAFFTSKRVEWLDKKSLEGEGFQSMKEKDKESLARAVKITGTKMKNSEWSTQNLELDVLK